MSLTAKSMLSKKTIEELKTDHKKHYGEDLSDDEAWEIGNRLLRVFAAISRPMEEPRVRPKGKLVDSV